MAQDTPQDELYFRPPSEAESFLIRVMRGCSHNKCAFCNMYKGVPLEVLPLEDVLRGMEQDARDIGPKHLHMIESLYLEGGDPLALPARHLARIMEHAHACFPHLTRVACYATARSIIHKTPEELALLAEAGLRRVHVGVESGLDAILKSTGKGCTRADLLRAGELLAGAGIENDVSIMLGIGGQALSFEHARATAELLSAIRPACVRIRTYVPAKDTALGDEYLAGRFLLMEPHAVLRELRLLVEHITAPMFLLSEHWSDFIFFEAHLPEDRDSLFGRIDQALLLPRESFRATGMSSERD